MRKFTDRILLYLLWTAGWTMRLGQCCDSNGIASSSSSSSELSRHYRLLTTTEKDDSTTTTAPNIVFVADGGRTTAGPFYFSPDLYVKGGNMLTTAQGRNSVLNGIPFQLTFVLYAVDRSTTTTTTTTVTPLPNATVFLWHTDALGMYSAVSSLNTTNQTWLRAQATSDGNGTLTFHTILPGWYPGRAIHFHFRVQLPPVGNNSNDNNNGGGNDYYVTSQLYLSDTFVQGYQDHPVYNTDNNNNIPGQEQQQQRSITWNPQDILYSRLDPDIASDLTLQLQQQQGDDDNMNGYTSTFHLGIDATDAGLTSLLLSDDNDEDNDENENDPNNNNNTDTTTTTTTTTMNDLPNTDNIDDASTESQTTTTSAATITTTVVVRTGIRCTSLLGFFSSVPLLLLLLLPMSLLFLAWL